MKSSDRSRSQLHHGLYEVHLPVTDLGRSIDFYVEKLGFELGFGTRESSSVLLVYDDDESRWMLGLFEVEAIHHRHPAEYHVSLRVAEQDVDSMVTWLRERGIEPVHPPTAPVRGSMEEPIVHGWMPAAAVFFRDPDDHLLELIADLDQEPRPDLAYVPWSEWRDRTGDG